MTAADDEVGEGGGVEGVGAVAEEEGEEVGEIVGGVVDGGRGQQERRGAGGHRLEAAPAAGVRRAEVVGLVDDEEVGSGEGERGGGAERLGRAEGDRDGGAGGRVTPHGAEGGRGDDQGRAGVAEEREGRPGLAEPDRVGEEGAAVGAKGVAEAGEGDGLVGVEHDRADPGAGGGADVEGGGR
jgi:hypothetical protein